MSSALRAHEKGAAAASEHNDGETPVEINFKTQFQYMQSLHSALVQSQATQKQLTASRDRQHAKLAKQLYIDTLIEDALKKTVGALEKNHSGARKDAVTVLHEVLRVLKKKTSAAQHARSPRRPVSKTRSKGGGKSRPVNVINASSRRIFKKCASITAAAKMYDLDYTKLNRALREGPAEVAATESHPKLILKLTQ